MTIFLVIGALGLALVLVSLIIGEVIGDLFGDFDAGGVLSTPVIGGFLAAFGFGAALILYSTSAHSGVAAVGGLGCGIAVGGLAALLMRSVMNMSTDASVQTSNMVGCTGSVITPIPEGGLGEISVSFHGQQMKVSARSATALAAGTPITVTAVTSPTSVVVAALTTDPQAPEA